MKIHQIIFSPTGGTQRVSEILLFMLLTCFLVYTQTTEAKGQSPCPSYGASIINGDLYCGHQEDSAFAMHSVMKFPQALYVADYLHKKGLTLSDSVLVHKDSLDAETWSPMLSIFEGMRYFTFAELIEWSLKQSDNNACDLLFASCGQPDAVEKYIHTLGFKDIHVQLTEKEMKKNPHKATENSATPKEMTRLLEWFYLHRNDNKNLSFIWDTMADCNTGQQRIAAALPQGGKLIHKTGSGFPSSDGRQDRNDVGIVLLPDGSHLSIAIFLQKSKEEKEVAEIAEQCLMRIQADEFLLNLPPDLQHKQTLAILRAIDGDNKELLAVRNARNAPPKYSDHVETKMITPNMRLYEPKGSQDQRLPVLLYLHGGGWTFGSINSCGRFCDAQAASGKMRVIALDYRLAPEHPYPEGLDDCISAVNYIIDHAAELHIDANHITTLPLMEQQLANFCDTCARKLRMQKSLCAQLIVFAHTSRFRTDIEQCQIVQTVNLSIPTSDTRELLSYMLNAFRPYFREGVQFKKAGVIFSRIVPEGSVVADLFDERDRTRDAALQRTIDKIREKAGRNAILLATQLPTSKEQAAQVYKSEHQSPRYTTELSQVLTIRI